MERSPRVTYWGLDISQLSQAQLYDLNQVCGVLTPPLILVAGFISELAYLPPRADSTG